MKTPVSLLAALSLVTVSTLGATGCVIRETRGSYTTRGTVHTTASVAVGNPGYVYVQTLPPDPLYETISPAPSYGSVWIDGYWHWNGYEWIWVGGHWESPRDGFVYIQPYYDYSDGYYVYNPGYWEHNTRVPGTVVVREHGDGRPPTGYHPNRPGNVIVTTTPAGGHGSNVTVREHAPAGGTNVVVRPNDGHQTITVGGGNNPPTGSGNGGTVVVTPPQRRPDPDDINRNPDEPIRTPGDRGHGKPNVTVTEPPARTTPTVVVTPPPARTTTTTVTDRPADPPRDTRPVRVNTDQDPPPRPVVPTTGGGVRVNPTPVQTTRPAQPVQPARTVTPAAQPRPAAPAVQPRTTTPTRPAAQPTAPVKPAAPAKPAQGGGVKVKVRSK